MLQLESFPVITLKNVISEGNLVVVESTGKATTKAGKPYNQSYCDIFRFVGEQLQEITTYLDTAVNRNQWPARGGEPHPSRSIPGAWVLRRFQQIRPHRVIDSHAGVVLQQC
jgi:hypothetical protein